MEKFPLSEYAKNGVGSSCVGCLHYTWRTDNGLAWRACADHEVIARFPGPGCEKFELDPQYTEGIDRDA